MLAEVVLNCCFPLKPCLRSIPCIFEGLLIIINSPFQFTLKEKSVLAGFGGQAASLIRPGRGGGRMVGWGWVLVVRGGGYFERGTGGGDCSDTALPGRCKHLTGDGSESTWLRHGKRSFQMQTSTPPPFNAANSHPRLGEESGGRFSPCSPLLETGGAQAGARGSVALSIYYDQPAQAPQFASFLRGDWELRVLSDPTEHRRLII